LTFAYVRISTNKQDLQNQKHSLLQYANEQNLGKIHFIEVISSSLKKEEDRKITELLEKMHVHDHLIVSELNRLGRSVVNVVDIINRLIAKRIIVHVVKENLLIEPDKRNAFSEFQINVFSAFAQLERDLISQRTKEALQARKAKGLKLGKPKGTIQKSIYDKDKDKIQELYGLGVSITNISKIHLKYGTIKSLSEYIKKRINLSKNILKAEN